MWLCCFFIRNINVQNKTDTAYINQNMNIHDDTNNTHVKLEEETTQVPHLEFHFSLKFYRPSSSSFPPDFQMTVDIQFFVRKCCWTGI